MSMLAEPRRKVKWSVDPRNSSWSNDDSKFGQKMLERMGWSKGKGLGRSEQGSTEHVKVQVKNNSYGLGANVSHEDNWIAHQDEFNQLLEQLNNCHSQSGNETPPEEQKGFSLEEKSKTSRKRVHYMKFTKGKDLSSRSETDLNCIFGKRAKSVKEQENNSNSSHEEEEKEEEESLPSVPSQLDTESITKTVKSSMTMQEYFAQRMAQLKKTRDSASSVGPSQEGSPDHDTGVSTGEPKKKKKKKKSRKSGEDGEETHVAPILSLQDHKEARPGKKTKKRKAGESCVPDPDAERPASKKKKSKKDKIKLLNGHEQIEHLTLEPEIVHQTEGKKKSKKDKKKKKKHQQERE